MTSKTKLSTEICRQFKNKPVYIVTDGGAHVMGIANLISEEYVLIKDDHGRPAVIPMGKIVVITEWSGQDD